MANVLCRWVWGERARTSESALNIHAHACSPFCSPFSPPPLLSSIVLFLYSLPVPQSSSLSLPISPPFSPIPPSPSPSLFQSLSLPFSHLPPSLSTQSQSHSHLHLLVTLGGGEKLEQQGQAPEAVRQGTLPTILLTHKQQLCELLARETK